MPQANFLLGCEIHDAERIAETLDAGVRVDEPIDGLLPLTWLLEMYTRSDRFVDCLRVLLDRGATFDYPDALPVLLNDANAIHAAAVANPSWLTRCVRWRSAFTPLEGGSLLHVAAEYGHVEATQALLELGADVNARAEVDQDGLGGHTPLFHAVNSNANRSAPVMRLLLDAGASSTVQVPGLVWGRGFEWETTFFDLTPIAYAQCGLLPQMHRDARDIDANVRAILAAAGRPVPAMPNVPNAYVVRSQSSRARGDE